MGEIFKLFGTIGLNNEEANKGIDETTGKAKGAGSKIAGFFKKAAVAIGAAFAVTKVIGFGKMAVEAAATAKAIQSQFDQVFGSLGTEAQTKVEELGKSFGMLPNRLKQPFAATVSMFKGLGMTTEEAMAKAETSVTAAADAAAFYDVSYETANSSLTSFLKGNYEAGEAIGIFANETQMAQYAISQGLVGSTADWQKLDEATKQATRLEYAKNMQEQAGATGQAARESEGYENQVGNLKQAWQDFLAVVGGPILEPVVAGLMGVSDWLSTAGEKVVAFQGWFGSLKAEVADSTAWGTLKEVMQPVVDAFQSMKDTMSNSTFLDDLKAALTELKDAMLEIDFVKMKDDIQAFIDKWLPLIAGIGGAAAVFAITTGAITLFNAALGIGATVAGFASLAYTAVGVAMLSINWPLVLVAAAIAAVIAIGVLMWQNWDVIKEKAKELASKVSEKFNELKDKASESIQNMKTAVTNKFNELKTSAVATVVRLKDSAVNKFNEMKSAVVSKIAEMKSNTVAKFSEMKTAAVEKFQALKSGVTEKASGVVSSVKSKFTEVYDGIMTPINKAKNAVSTAIDKMKGFFNFSWKLPKISMPTFSVSGSKNPLKWITEGVPKLSVNWNAAGGIFDKATIFDTSRGLQGVGEGKDPEAIIPLNRDTLGGIGRGISDEMVDDKESKKEINITNYITTPEPLTEREASRQMKLSLQRLAYGL